MPTAYSPLLGLALPVTGELAGTWGDTVNNYITTYLDSSVAGTQTISGSQTAVTLSVTNGTTLTQVGSGATGSAQYNIINCTGNPASLLTITAPAQSKTYLIINATSTNQSVKIVGTGPTTGVTLIAGERALVAWNGSDFIKVATTAAAGGSNTQVQYNNNGVLTGSANLTFDGTNLTLGGGTANGVAYLNGSKVLTTGSALSFDGATLATTGQVLAGYGSSVANVIARSNVANGGSGFSQFLFGNTSVDTRGYLSYSHAADALLFGVVGSEQARLTSTGLGIGTSSPVTKLNIASAAGSPTGVSVGAIRVYETTNNYGLNIGGDGTYGYIQGLRGTTSTLGYNDLVLQPNSGNLGLGVTPSAWNVGSAIDISSRGSISDSSAVGTSVGRNAYYNAGWKYKLTSASQLYLMDDGGHKFFTAPSGTAGNAISFTQAMTLDASGNLGVGTTSPGTKLVAVQTLQGNDVATGAELLMTTSTATNDRLNLNFSMNGIQGRARAAIGAVALDATGGYNCGLAFYTRNANDGSALATTDERARITSGGDLLVGTSSGQVAATVVAYRSSAATACVGPWNAATTGDNLFVVFNTEATATLRGSIDYNRAGGLVRYNTTSDYRAKDIIGPAKNTGATIDALKVYEGVMKGATQSRPMMIAHEAQEVVPFCVSGAKDETNEDGTPKYQQMDHASLVPLLIAELQSLRARVAQIEAK